MDRVNAMNMWRDNLGEREREKRGRKKVYERERERERGAPPEWDYILAMHHSHQCNCPN